MAPSSSSSARGSLATQTVRAPRGSKLSCRGWPQEAALRMLMNSLDEEVAEQPRNLLVDGSTGRAAHDWPSYHAIVGALRELQDDETLVVQSGKPTGIVKTSELAPRVLIIGSSQPRETAERSPRPLPTSPGHWRAVEWAAIGQQAALATLYETFAAVARRHFHGELAGRWVVAGGMGGTGGAQGLAATLHGAVFLGIEADGERIRRRVRSGYCDIGVNSLEEALRLIKNAVRQKRAVSVGLVGNCAEVLPELARRGAVPDVLTDLTGADDPLGGYLPAGVNADEAATLRERNPEDYRKRSLESLARHANAVLELKGLGAVAFDLGNHLGWRASVEAGVRDAESLPNYMTEYLQPLLDEGRRPLRWVALSGERSDIRRVDALAAELLGDDRALNHWIQLAQRRVRFQGLPARAAWLTQEQRVQWGVRIHQLVQEGQLKAPFVLAPEQLDGGSRGAAGERSDAAEGPKVEAFLSWGCGASWVSFEREEGRERAGLAVVADGSRAGAERLERALRLDGPPGALISAEERQGHPKVLSRMPKA